MNRTMNLLAALAATALLGSCQAEADENTRTPQDGGGEPVAVDFLVPSVSPMGSDGQTRGVSALPEGATVSIWVGNVGEAQTFDLRVANQTYYVKEGRLVPCKVDKDGKFLAEDPDGKISLEPREYTFYAHTPALETVSHSVDEGFASVRVPQNVDYAMSFTKERIVSFTGAVALNALTHECARLQLKVNSDDAAITAMTVKSATLTGFSGDSRETYIGNSFFENFDMIVSGTKSATTTAFTQDATNPKLSNADLFLLPCIVTDPVKVAYEIAYTVLGIERTETVSADLPSLTLTAGKSYTLTANFAKDGGIHLSISDWEQSDQYNSMGEGTYPYVQSGNTIVSKDLYGSAGGIFHKSWTTTPDHSEISGFFYAVSPRFEVAVADAGVAPWGSANTGCTAPWRRPTMGELRLIYDLRGQLSRINTAFVDYGYWTAASTPSGSHAWYKNLTGGKEANTLIGNSAYTRCIKDAYPYVTKNAGGRLLVVVSKDEYGSSGATLHPNWLTTPAHYNTDAANNTMSAMFEVMSYNLSGNWYQATGTYHATHNPTTAKVCPDGWRMPTFTELRYIALNQGVLGGGFVQNNYWSATEESTNSEQEAHMQGFGYTSTYGARAKSWAYFLRCVRDL